MWMLFGMVTVAAGFALGFVLGRVWQIRMEMRSEQAKEQSPELPEHVIGWKLRSSIAQTLASLRWVEHQSEKLRGVRR